MHQYIENYKKNRTKYKIWGDFVLEHIKCEIESRDLKVDSFFKCTPTSRTKKPDSIYGKIVKYNLTEPFSEIKDLVGIRLVVLLSEDIQLILDIIKEYFAWDYEITRDFLESRSDFPEVFDYESLHVCVAPKGPVEIKGELLDSSIVCEIQVRTILQHAYAELTHDNIYKPLGKKVSKSARRFVARSQALMESTDHFFCETMKELRRENKPRLEFLQSLGEIYKSKIHAFDPQFDMNFNLEQIERYCLPTEYEMNLSEIKKYCEENPHIINRTIEKSIESFIFRQPIILLYFLRMTNSSKFRREFYKKEWQGSVLDNDIKMIYSVLGFGTGIKN